MALTMNQDVLMLSVEDDIGPHLERWSDSRGWSLLRSPTLKGALKRVVADRPQVVVLHVSTAYERALRLIRMIQTSWRRSALLVAVVDHDDTFERAVRIAGATHYMADGESAAMVDDYVERMLQPNQRIEPPILVAEHDEDVGLDTSRFRLPPLAASDRFTDDGHDVFRRAQ